MFLGGRGFDILIHKYFSEEWGDIYQFSLKSKITEHNSAAIFSLNFILINLPSCFCCVFIFLIYETYIRWCGEKFPCCSLTNMEVIPIYYILLFNHYKFNCDYLYFPSNVKDIKTRYKIILEQHLWKFHKHTVWLWKI